MAARLFHPFTVFARLVLATFAIGDLEARFCRAADTDGLPADKVFFNGTILTMDAQRRVAEAVAVRDGKILMAGSEIEVRKLAGPKTMLEDLHGGTMMPGFYAAHD